MIRVYGLKVSYFTGKLEGYLRYKEIPYEFVPIRIEDFNRTIPEQTGAKQMPAVELPDGRWMTDTGPMIHWFETQYPDPPILPADPAQAFLCHLIEDYADEWLWRPAMHFRWSYPNSAELLSREIIDVMAADLKIPAWLLRRRTKKRQKHNFVDRDGVNERTRGHVEQGYKRLLDLLGRIFETRPFLFGARPTLADIGLFGPCFRHLSMDPDPARIMRETAPGVMEWVYRLWNARASRTGGDLVEGVPEDIEALLKEIGETHLEALCANAAAWADGRDRHDMTIQGVGYADLQTSRYRVWCLEELQRRYAELEAGPKAQIAEILERTGCFEPLMRIADIESGYDAASEAPFGSGSIAVFPKIED